MNFDDLKNSWADATVEDMPSLIEHLPLEATSPAVNKIRRNMRNEFIAQVLSYWVIIIVFIAVSKTALSILIVILSTFILLMQTGYYFWRFYIFYRQISRYDLSLKKSIRKFIYELELNIEIYKTYSFCAMPLATLAGLAILAPHVVTAFVRYLIDSGSWISPGPLVLTAIILVISQGITAFFVNLHIKIQYGRYLKELKTLMDDLEAEE
jgi:hypothetical protein